MYEGGREQWRVNRAEEKGKKHGDEEKGKKPHSYGTFYSSDTQNDDKVRIQMPNLPSQPE